MHRFLTSGLLNGTNSLVSINDVPSGLKCNCVCPNCKSVLVAKKGKKLQWHFAHANNAECSGARMTALHLWAQQIIGEEKRILLPPYKGEYYKTNALNVVFDDVLLEQRIPIEDRHIQPDCVGLISQNGIEHELWIEILVTHEVDEKKLRDIKKLQKACIEIDLADLLDTDYTKDIIKERLTTICKDRKWLNNPVCEEKNKEGQRKAEEERQDREEKQRQIERDRRNEAIDFIRSFLNGQYPASTFRERYGKKNYFLREEIKRQMSYVFYSIFFHPDEEDIQKAFLHASLLENMPASFEFEEIFDELNGDTFIKYIDCNNDSDGRMNLYKTFLKCAYRKGFYIRRYSWDDRDYEPAFEAIKDELYIYRLPIQKLSSLQSRRLERYVLAYCYDCIQANAKGEDKEMFYTQIEKSWKVISCLFSLYLHHIIANKFTNFAQLTEYFIYNHAEYAHLYLKIAQSPLINGYISGSIEDKLDKMKRIVATTQIKSDLNKITRLLFPQINFHNIY